MVRDFGIMIFRIFIAGMCVSVSHAIACHGKEKNKKRSDTLWGLVCHACSKTAHSGNRGTSDRRVFHAFCDHDDCCWTDQQKISWEMIYCTVWPLIVYHCINIIWNSLHRVSAIEQQPRVLQYLFSLLFLQRCICYCPSRCSAGFREMDFTRQDQEEHSQQQQCFSYPCFLTTIFTRTVENPILRFWFSYIA